MKKLTAVFLSAVMLLSLGGCGTGEDTQEKYVVGISQLVQHEALDAATQGFMDALEEKLGDKVEFDVQNAQGDSANCATIVNGFVSADVDLILANATPALQAAAAGTGEIPILGTSITNYPVALDIEDQDGATGINVSGTSDLAH
jgi:putative ABC transport system substrate-binding protein